MKSTKKVLAVIIAIMMLTSIMSVTAFAANDRQNYTVTIYVQTASRNASGNITSTTVLNGGTPVLVSVPSGATLKDAIDTACATTGSAITNAGWTSGMYLNSLTVNGTPYTEYGSYPNNHTYIGSSWMYFNDVPANTPATINNYPATALSVATVTGNTTITLSFESMIYTW